MGARLAAPLEKTFPLPITDALLNNQGSPSTVTIRQATEAAFRQRANIFAVYRQEYLRSDPDVTRYETRFSQNDLNMIEVMLTMVGCNLEDEDGRSLFTFPVDGRGRPQPYSDQVSFAMVWGKLAPEMCDEIHKYVLEVNPKWDPTKATFSGGDVG